MATMIWCDAFTCFYVLLVGLVFVAAMCTRRGARFPTRVDVRGVGHLPARPYRIEDKLSQGSTSHDRAPTPIKGLYASVLEVYARQFEEANRAHPAPCHGLSEARGQITLGSRPRRLAGRSYS